MAMATAVSESILTQVDEIPTELVVSYAYTLTPPIVRVPVYVKEGKPFAPPFLIPKGTWTVHFDLKTEGWVFGGVTFHSADCTPTLTQSCESLPSGVELPLQAPVTGGKTLRVSLDTNGVALVNSLGCTLTLDPAPDSLNFLLSSAPISGDPTIAVVKEPIG